MEKFKAYLLGNFEQAFILIILVTVFLINYYIPQKMAFLNFYFLPIIMAGYYLGLRLTVLGAFLCIILVATYTTLYPHQFIMPSTPTDLYLHIAAWGGFLILSGTVVGKQQEKLSSEIKQTLYLNKELQKNQEELKEANQALKNQSQDLEQSVRQRTEELEKSKQSVESLKTRVEEALFTTMDSSVAKLMIEGRLRNEKRSVSVMFSDLVGFTTYSEERSPEIAVRDLNRYLNDMEPILMDYRGHIDKYLGDGIMAEFGAPLDYEHYRLLAVLAAIKMQNKMTGGGEDYPWEMRIAIASGSAIMGLIGSKRKAYTTIGDVVNLAARMEKVCSPGTVLIDGFTLEGVRNFVEYSPMKDLSLSEVVDGKTESRLDELHQRLKEAAGDKEKAVLYHEIGKLHASIDEIHEALGYFEKSLHLEPDNVDLKVAFAEATMQREDKEKLKVKGKRNRVNVYEVTGLKDVLLDREKIPASLYDKYHHILDRIDVPEEVILPIEALDGSIGHSKTVAFLSYAIASEIGLAEQDSLDILRAGFAADMGKEIIHHHLLNRRGTLNNNEFKEVEKHPEESTRKLKSLGYESENIATIIRHSHERLNGSGYPDGLREDEISTGSKIVAVADAYSAMTAWRPYRERLEQNAALDEIRKSSENGIFDPKIVEILDRLISEDTLYYLHEAREAKQM